MGDCFIHRATKPLDLNKKNGEKMKNKKIVESINMSLLIIILFSIFFQSTEVVSQTVLCHVEKCNRYVAFPLNILIFSEYVRGSKLLVENALLNFLSFFFLFNVND